MATVGHGKFPESYEKYSVGHANLPVSSRGGISSGGKLGIERSAGHGIHWE